MYVIVYDSVVFMIHILLQVAKAIFKLLIFFMPYVTGALAVVALWFTFPGLANIIPGEGKMSFITLLAVIELIVLILCKWQDTSGPTVLFTSSLFVDFCAMVVLDGMENPSWQKSLFHTAIYFIAMAWFVTTNHQSVGTERVGARNRFASVLVAFMYAASIGAMLLIVLGCNWSEYVKSITTEETYKIYDIGGLIFIIAAMIITFIVSIIRDFSYSNEVSIEELKASGEPLKTLTFTVEDEEKLATKVLK